MNRGEFLDWRRRETLVYTLGMVACFAKVLAKVGLVTLVAGRVDFSALRWMGATIDISWFVLIAWTLVMAYRLALRRTDLRIVLGGFVVADHSSLSSELREAISVMKSGELSRAEYLLGQVSLDADESLKAISTYYLGECYVLQGKLEEARDAFQESLELDPSLTEPHKALAKLRLQQKPADREH